jgi:hypothetical protein
MRKLDTTPPYSLQAGQLTKEELLTVCNLEREIFDLKIKSKLECVDFIKSKLGKQTYCWTGEFRFWTWDYPHTNWIVHVNNKKGICFEVLPDLTYEQIKAALDEFIGLLKQDSGIG